MKVQKGVALGNDYLVVDEADLSWPLTPRRCALLCDRHNGIGADGILLANLRAGIALRILNPDGTEAEKSGNGLRIFAAYLHGRGLVKNDWFSVQLVKDSVRAIVEGKRTDGSLDVRVEMGRASFRGQDVGFLPASGDVLGRMLALGDHIEAEIHTVSLSNPHCVVFVDQLERADFLARAPLLCTHPAFERGTNVQFVRIAGPGAIELWIWERGAGETLASGSSACAAASAAVRRGFLEPGRIEARMPGGTADIDVSEAFHVRLRGPARMLFSAQLEPELVQLLGTMQD
jgi:diaminopimelate epimerase